MEAGLDYWRGCLVADTISHENHVLVSHSKIF